ncbi:unnamed protein product [Oppiella nova]|uniref:Uncharacterized protein n=1 Tax=Oppiella nova TaxID=334625 RepID=A0A7R9LTJ4_9ACAR|nr:unnamed protein product [Oppiella nova]CAG2166828.1 unnamed protein product [Oppiella nova]
MFVTAYNADVKDQLTPLAKGCLPVLCSQLDSDDKEYLNLVLLTIISFLFWEFKAFLGKEKKLLTSEDTLSPFAVIIQDCDGLQRLNQINGHRRDKESNNKYYMPTQGERRVEEILALAFHKETRPQERQQSVYVLYTFPEVNPRVKQEQCLGCKKEMDAQKKFVRADTTIFSCHHLNLCRPCAVKGVTKMYNQESDVPTYDYSIKLNEFKEKVFPRLWEQLSTTSALMLLQLILYNDYKIQKSQLIKSALKASLVPQLVNIYETTRDIQTKQLVINLFSVFCLSFESNPKLRKHVLSNNAVIDSILR